MKFSRFTALTLMFGALAWPTVAAARMAAEAPMAQPGASLVAPMPPEPPRDNPHPPQDMREQGRVDFAVEQAEKFYGVSLVELKHGHVIPWSWQRFKPRAVISDNDPQVIVEAQAGGASSGPVRVYPGVPQLNSDEYIVHAYVRFANDMRWHHLDIVLAEDTAGQLALRGFYAIPMPSGGHLPPGVVC